MVKQGYKKTEVGVIPEDWDCVAAKHLMKIETGSRNTEHKTDIGKYPFFVRSQKVERIDTYHYDCEAVLTAGDGVGTGKVFHHYIGKFDAHQRVYVMSNFDGITGRYFYNYFSENFGNEVSKYTAKSSVDSVRRDMIAEMLIPTPPIPEQERIAEALLDVDNMISSLEKLIAKKKTVKQGAMQELLTGKKRLPGFTREWDRHKLGEYVDCVRGVSYNGSNDVFGSESNQTIRLLRSNNIQDAKFDSNDVQYIRRNIVRDNQILKTYDIMICMANGSKQLVGKNCIFTEALNEKYTFGAFMSCLRAKKADTNMNYIFELLNSTQYWNNIALLLSGSSINNLRPDNILEMEFKFPSIAEQAAIASILSDMDNEIETLEQKLEKTRQVKQGMMQQLLTGKIRLV